MKRIRDLEARYWLDRIGPALIEVGFRFEPVLDLECPACSKLWTSYHGGLSIWPGPMALRDPQNESFLKNTLFLHQHLNEYFFLALDNENKGSIRRYANTRDELEANILSLALSLTLFENAVTEEYQVPPDVRELLRRSMSV